MTRVLSLNHPWYSSHMGISLSHWQGLCSRFFQWQLKCNIISLRRKHIVLALMQQGRKTQWAGSWKKLHVDASEISGLSDRFTKAQTLKENQTPSFPTHSFIQKLSWYTSLIWLWLDVLLEGEKMFTESMHWKRTKKVEDCFTLAVWNEEFNCYLQLNSCWTKTLIQDLWSIILIMPF